MTQGRHAAWFNIYNLSVGGVDGQGCLELLVHCRRFASTEPATALRVCALRCPAAVPVGVGSEGSLRLGAADMDKLLTGGMAWLEEKGMCWPEDREVTEEHVSGIGQVGAGVSPLYSCSIAAYQQGLCWCEDREVTGR